MHCPKKLRTREMLLIKRKKQILKKLHAAQKFPNVMVRPLPWSSPFLQEIRPPHLFVSLVLTFFSVKFMMARSDQSRNDPGWWLPPSSFSSRLSLNSFPLFLVCRLFLPLWLSSSTNIQSLCPLYKNFPVGSNSHCKLFLAYNHAKMRWKWA